jgi:hypothetical protein
MHEDEGEFSNPRMRKQSARLALPNQPMYSQRQHEEHGADADAYQQRMFGATKAASDKTSDARKSSDCKPSNRSQSAGFTFHGNQRRKMPSMDAPGAKTEKLVSIPPLRFVI